MPYIFQQIQDKAIKQGIGQQDVADAREWFRDEARKINAANPTRFMNDPSFKKENRLNLQSIGKMYMFFYDPKMKDTLPYYDRFPLVFPFKRVPGGFMGLNMHYIPYQMRVMLLQRLMDFATDKTLTENTRLKLSWRLIAGVSKFKWAEPCVKHYLNDHIRSTFRKIDAPDWTTAMLLPVEQFVGANKNKVWKDSIGF